MVVPLSSLIERLEGGASPDAQLDEDLRDYALTGKPDWPDHETPQLTARLDQATALPGYLGIGWDRIMQNVGDVEKWSAAAELAKTGDESPFCRRFMIAVLNAAKDTGYHTSRPISNGGTNFDVPKRVFRGSRDA